MIKKILLIAFAISLIISGCANPRNTTDPSAQAHRTGTEDSLDYLGRTTRNFAQPDPNIQGGPRALQRNAPNQEQANNGSVQVSINQKSLQTVPVRSHEGETYLPLLQILDLLDYNVNTEGNTIKAGFTDIQLQVTKESNQAVVDAEKVTLPSPIISLDNDFYITASSLDALLGLGYKVSLNDSTLSIVTTTEETDFPGNEKLDHAPTDETEDVPTLTSTQADGVIASARKYLGVPYQFGANVNTTRAFDCSSFTKRVFQEHGLTLPRTARAQANVGRYIPVSQLKKGDLVFFTWPGRFQNNKVPGHVGIYMGNGYVIHTTPSKGVHIVNAAKSSYWRQNYLGARRIGS